ncbi:11114_t:CDS:2 [Dentiscutata erythropus]|uniref:11114_t:CDS:1 n=1 Tax=Dentiscutata erythropus TaxID=1348616 RepID=A0A9N9CT12_9GLOM|nr:11114_t:CDS:2 [Dentiscutata erythropus]
METETIQVPRRSIGHILGKHHSKINEIERNSKAHCTLNKNNNSIVVKGTNEARKIALNLINDCVWNSIAPYKHPREAIIALQPPLIRLKTILFSKYEGIIDRNNMNKVYFVLDKGEEMNEIDKLFSFFRDLFSLFENLNIKRTTNIIAPEKDRKSVEHIAKRIIEQTTKPDNRSLDFKVRVNIGKQLFYPPTRESFDLSRLIPLYDFLKYEIGYRKDAKTTFMNHISFEVAKIIENRLVELEYQKSSEIIQRASIHLIDIKARKRFLVSTDITSDGKLIPRKLKAENNKLLYYSFVSPKPALDFHLRVLSQEPSRTILPIELYNSIKNATYDPDTKILTLRNPPNSNYLFTITRIKTRRTFVKCKDKFSNGNIKVTISEVYQDGKNDMQVAITSKALHQIIKKMSQTDRIEENLRLKCDKEIERFINEVRLIVNKLYYYNK